jgi:hypothetical protein
MTDSAIEQVLTQEIDFVASLVRTDCKYGHSDYLMLDSLDAALEYWLLRHRNARVSAGFCYHLSNSDPTGLIKYGQNAWDSKKGFICDCLD